MASKMGNAMTTDIGKKPLIGHFEVWGTDECMNDNCTGRITLFVANKKCISCDPESYTKESVQVPPCTNCERLEGDCKIISERLREANEWDLKHGETIQRLQKQLEMCIEALKLGTEHPETGGVFWRENILAKLEKE